MAKYAGSIVVTAMGAVSPFGLGVDALWSALLQGERHGVLLKSIWSARQPEYAAIDATAEERSLWGQQVGDCNLVELVGKRGFQYLRSGTTFLLGASILATREAGLANGETNPDELGITVGSNLAGFQSMVDYDYTAITEGPHYTSPMEAPNTLANAPASHLAIRLKARALNTTIASGQCAGLDALGYAAKMVRDGRARQLVVGGVEELSPAALWVYHNAGVVSTGSLEDAGRPFNPRSTGWLPSEGAAVVVLERKAEAETRGARPLAQLAGWSSAFAPTTDLAKRASVLRKTAQQALAAAGLTPDDLDVVVCGANGYRNQDQAEALALRELLAHNPSACITTIKATLGETYGASGLFQALAAVSMLERGIVLPNPGATSQSLLPGNELHSEARPWAQSKQGTVLLLEQDLFGSTSAVVLRGCQQ